MLRANNPGTLWVQNDNLEPHHNFAYALLVHCYTNYEYPLNISGERVRSGAKQRAGESSERDWVSDTIGRRGRRHRRRS